MSKFKWIDISNEQELKYVGSRWITQDRKYQISESKGENSNTYAAYKDGLLIGVFATFNLAEEALLNE